MIKIIGLIAAIILPLFNIPLMIRVVKRKSSQDISLWWAVGVWICFAVMAPSGFTSADLIWKAFNISNFVLFSCVLVIVLRYRK